MNPMNPGTVGAMPRFFEPGSLNRTSPSHRRRRTIAPRSAADRDVEPMLVGMTFLWRSSARARRRVFQQPFFVFSRRGSNVGVSASDVVTGSRMVATRSFSP